MSNTSIEVVGPARGVVLGTCRAPGCANVATRLLSFTTDYDLELGRVHMDDHPLCAVHLYALVSGTAYEVSGLADDE